MRLLIIIGFLTIVTTVAYFAFSAEDYLYEKLYFNKQPREEQIEILKKLEYTNEEIVEFFKARNQDVTIGIVDSTLSLRCSSHNR